MMGRLTLGLLLLSVAALAVGIVVGLDPPARRALASRFIDPDPVSSRSAPSSSPAGPSSSQPPHDATRPPPEPDSTTSATPRASSTPTPNKTPKARRTNAPRKVVYLTFDDGPSAFTPQVLHVLRQTGSTATFFQLGVNAGGRQRLQAAIRAQGSNIGNHSYDHPDLTQISAQQLRRQIADGPRSTCFRPPYGATNGAVRDAVERAGARQVLWTVDTMDWQKPGAAELRRLGASRQIHSGSIILMHDGGGDRTQTVAALPGFIHQLKARGYVVRALPNCS